MPVKLKCWQLSAILPGEKFQLSDNSSKEVKSHKVKKNILSFIGFEATSFKTDIFLFFFCLVSFQAAGVYMTNQTKWSCMKSALVESSYSFNLPICTRVHV